MSTTAKASLKYKWPSWIVYDQNFRQETADKGLMNWAQVDPSIYTQCFTAMTITQEDWCKICLSIDHSSESCSLKQARKQPAVTSIATNSKRAQYEPNPLRSVEPISSLGLRVVVSVCKAVEWQGNDYRRPKELAQGCWCQMPPEVGDVEHFFVTSGSN